MDIELEKLRKQVKKILNYYTNSMNVTPRSIGDEIEAFIRQHLHQNYNVIDNITAKSVADVFIQDKKDWYIDIKCHNANKSSVPNLISVDRLLKLYESTKPVFVIIKVDYEIEENKVSIKDVDVFRIEDLSLDGLNIANIGKGQIQLKNSELRKNQSRKAFKEGLIEMYKDFLKNQISVFKKMLDEFN